MRGIGVLEDGFVFTEAELERGTPRFWWGLRKRAASIAEGARTIAADGRASCFED